MLCAVFSATLIQIKQREQWVLRGCMHREGSLERVPVKLQGESLAGAPAFQRKFLCSRCKLVSLSHGTESSQFQPNRGYQWQKQLFCHLLFHSQ